MTDEHLQKLLDYAERISDLMEQNLCLLCRHKEDGEFRFMAMVPGISEKLGLGRGTIMAVLCAKCAAIEPSLLWQMISDRVGRDVPQKQ